jgi:hypothetical protein
MSPIKQFVRVRGILVLPIFLFFACWLLAAGCSRAHIAVSNLSGSTVSNLTISGSCKERHLDTLASWSEWRVVTPFQGDAVIQFFFSSSGKDYSTNSDIHVGYRGPFMLHFTIGSNMVVTSQVIY